jgi:Cys-tRNA(Pro) deacylase
MHQDAKDQIPPASLELERQGIPHRVFRHAGVVTSLVQAADERGQRPEQVVRSILFRLRQGHFVMVLARGGSQISWRKLRQHLSQSRLTLATEDEVLRITGYAIGSVSPFGLRQRVRILVDRQVLEEEQISIGAGWANTGLILGSQDLMNALTGAEILDLVEGA